MTSQVFYRKWRPQTLADVVGQETVTRTLHHALGSGRVSHAYLFCGPRGTGKTSTGRILAKAVNCLSGGQGEPCNTCEMCREITEGRSMDVIEIDAASNRGIDDIRDLRERVNYAPARARRKVYIIDEVHMLSKDASNALLKTLEEPPPHAIFILATTEFHKVLPTILSRCQHFDFRRLSQADVAAKLGQISEAEGIKIEPESLRLIARAATGSLRDAENLLEQLTTFYGKEIGIGQVRNILGITGDARARELARYIVENNLGAGMAAINSINSDGLDLRQFNRELVDYLRGLLLVKTGCDGTLEMTAEDRAELKELAARASLPQVLKALKLFGQLDGSLHGYSTLPLELALAECVVLPQETTAPPPAPAKAPGKPAAAPPSQPAPAATPPPKPPRKIEPKPEPSPPERGPETAVPAAPLGGLKELKEKWEEIISQSPADARRTRVPAILRSGTRVIAVEGSTVVLAFNTSFFKEQMEKVENQRLAVRILSSFMGAACQIRCVDEQKSDHLVKEALRMGAEIIPEEKK